MIEELVELGKRVISNHPALGECQCDYYINISKTGDFIAFNPYYGNPLLTKYIPSTAKNGKARLLLDNAEYTLGFESTNKSIEHYNTYIKELEHYKDLADLSPIFSFYSKHQEVEKALSAFKQLPKSKQKGNITFMVESSTLLLNLESIQEAIKRKYDEGLGTTDNKYHYCAVCGRNIHPIKDEPHGGVNLPGSDKKCSLVSFNKTAFESYNLKGNLNSNVCADCARHYVEGLKFLSGNGYETINEKGEKSFKYTNRQRINDDTVAMFWTKVPDEDIDPFSDICQPTEERMRRLFSSVVTGDHLRVDAEVDNYFYCCTISSAAARIAVRDWMAISVTQYQKNLKQWFEDIATIKDGIITYPGINTILNNCVKKKSKPTQSDYKAKARIGVMLWHAALTNSSLPVMILQCVLDQIEHEKETKYSRPFSAEKTTVIRLVLNRNNKNIYKMKEELDEQNESKAYLCGRLFALICKLQFKAQGAVNSSIKDRFFAAASNMPGAVMGTLITKYVPVYEKKTKGAYSKAITEIASRIGHFPDKFSLADRGEFALGYYYQYNAKQNDNNND